MPQLIHIQMLKYGLLIILLQSSITVHGQSALEKPVLQKQDSTKNTTLLKSIGNGYFPTKFFNIDLRYLIKFNQYEGIRSGLGGITNKAFSKRYRINTYLVYGFRDHRFKYSIGGGFRVSKETNTWINLSYTNDLEETGSTNFLTDGRFFQFFEPRLLNIDLFHKHITQAIALEHQLHPKLLTEVELATSNIDPTYSYSYVVNNEALNTFHLSTAKIGVQWSPFSEFKATDNGIKATKMGYPQFTLQYTKNFNGVLGSNLGFSKLDFKTIYRIEHRHASFSEATLISGIANGDVPLTHLYHAYPNNITKETILQRFSVAGLTSFETMYFNEFFSDKFVTFQYKFQLKPFKISERIKPYLVLISRMLLVILKTPRGI